MNKSLYLLTMQRGGDAEKHHYTTGVYSDLAVAVTEALENELFRDNKYEFVIEILEVDKSSASKIPREVAINFAKLKFPEKFDDESNLITED